MKIQRNYRELNKKFKKYKLEQELELERRKRETEWFKKFGSLKDELPEIIQDEKIVNYVKGYGENSEISYEEMLEKIKFSKTLRYKRFFRKKEREKIKKRMKAKRLKEFTQEFAIGRSYKDYIRKMSRKSIKKLKKTKLKNTL